MKLLLIVALFTVLVERSSAATGITASKTIGNCVCNGVEIKDKGTQREFKASCKKTAQVKKGKKTVTETTWHTSCTYGGDPHTCSDYNKRNRQPKFYQGLINVIAADYCASVLKDNECKTQATYHSNTICTNIPYTFNKAGV